MKVTFAQFNVEHNDKSYGVQFAVQYVTQNQTFTTVTIYAVNEGIKRIVSNFSTAGRQVISPSNAKKFLRDALIAEGVIKAPRPPEPPTEEEILARASKPPVVQMLNTPGQEVNDQRKDAPGFLKVIREFFT